MEPLSPQSEVRIEGFRYNPTETGIKVHESDAKGKMIVGPFGSGKSCICAQDLYFYSLSQAPASDGVRYTKWGVIRGSYPEVASTTRTSIMEVFPSRYGSINEAGAPIRGLYRIPVMDGPYDYILKKEPWRPGYGTFAQVEFVLQALKTEEDAEKIRSANWTGAWINEATGVHKSIVMNLLGRVGRYPTEHNGGCTWAGILMDFNMPPRGHYLCDLMTNPLEGWELFVQPPAAFKIDNDNETLYEVNPEAENLQNLKGGKQYYEDQINGFLRLGRPDIVEALFCMLDVPQRDGKPVWPTFDTTKHVAKKKIEPVPYGTVVIGFDTSGIHPAAILLQEYQGRWCIIDELYGEDMGLEQFISTALVPLTRREKYSNCDFIVPCDPANARDSYTGVAPTAHLENEGFKVWLPNTNNPDTRIRVEIGRAHV